MKKDLTIAQTANFTQQDIYRRIVKMSINSIPFTRIGKVTAINKDASEVSVKLFASDHCVYSTKIVKIKNDKVLTGIKVLSSENSDGGVQKPIVKGDYCLLLPMVDSIADFNSNTPQRSANNVLQLNKNNVIALFGFLNSRQLKVRKFDNESVLVFYKNDASVKLSNSGLQLDAKGNKLEFKNDSVDFKTLLIEALEGIKDAITELSEQTVATSFTLQSPAGMAGGPVTGTIEPVTSDISSKAEIVQASIDKIIDLFK